MLTMATQYDRQQLSLFFITQLVRVTSVNLQLSIVCFYYTISQGKISQFTAVGSHVMSDDYSSVENRDESKSVFIYEKFRYHHHIQGTSQH